MPLAEVHMNRDADSSYPNGGVSGNLGRLNRQIRERTVRILKVRGTTVAAPTEKLNSETGIGSSDKHCGRISWGVGVVVITVEKISVFCLCWREQTLE